MRAVIFSVVALVCGCAAPAPAPDAGPPSPPSFDAGPTPGSCAAACANLRALGCEEGSHSCERTCVHVAATRLVNMHADCLEAATSKEAARACGSVSCP